jgi:acyl dehydratase
VTDRGSDEGRSPGWVSGNVLGSYGARDPLYELVEVPEKFGPAELSVDREKIKQFAYITDDYNAWHFYKSPFGPAIGHAALLANDLLQLFTLRYDPSRVVGLHTEEMLWFENPVFADERVGLEGSYVEKFQRRGQGYVVMEATARGEDGRTLLRHRGWEIMRTVPGDIAGRESAGATSRRVGGEFRTDVCFALRIDQRTPPGTPLQPLQYHVTPSQVSLFSRAGEYVRNIHNDLEKSREAGFDRPLIQGQHVVCLLSRLLTQAFGAAWFTTGWLHVKFLKPIFVGDVIALQGSVLGPNLDGGSTGEVQLEVWARNDRNEMAVAGWAGARPEPLESRRGFDERA